jgi:hypothetical protein
MMDYSLIDRKSVLADPPNCAVNLTNSALVLE